MLRCWLCIVFEKQIYYQSLTPYGKYSVALEKIQEQSQMHQMRQKGWKTKCMLYIYIYIFIYMHMLISVSKSNKGQCEYEMRIDALKSLSLCKAMCIGQLWI